MGGRGRPRAPWCPTRRCTLFSQIRERPWQLSPAAGDLLPLQGCQQLVDCKGPREVSTGPGTPRLGPGLLSVHAPSTKPWDRLCAGQPTVQDLRSQHLLWVFPGVSRLSPTPRSAPTHRRPAAARLPAVIPTSSPSQSCWFCRQGVHLPHLSFSTPASPTPQIGRASCRERV